MIKEIGILLSTMYKMLIVDDERAIVNGLFRLFEEESELQLDLFRAYSGVEAYELIRTQPMDIVLSDIRMPGMTGLELQKKVKELWPGCQFIFLTGFDEFHYVQEALRNEGTDYILKTEEDSTIVLSVGKAVERLNKQLEIHISMAEAALKLKQALPILQKELLWEFLQEEGAYNDSRLLRQIQELDFPLSLDREVLLMVARVDDWGNKTNTSDRMLMLYAMTNIVKEYLGSTAELYPLANGQGEVVWLIQDSQMLAAETVSSSKRIALLMNNASESILEACKRYLGITISLIVASEAVSWETCRVKFNRLRRLLFVNHAMRRELALSEANLTKAEEGLHAESPDTSAQRQQRKMLLLDTYLETGQREAFNELFYELVRLTGENEAEIDVVQMHLYYGIVTLFLSYLHQLGQPPKGGSQLDIRRLTHMEQHGSWAGAVQYLQGIADLLFSVKNDDLDERDREVIRKIKRYVEQNLAGDLSLTHIADLVGFNRSYLSRLYKQKTGEGLSEYILDMRLKKAKELLRQPAIKIHEISEALGFESAAYFTRFFKKMTNLTPTEFRELNQ